MKHVRERELTRKNRSRRPANLKVGCLVLVHHSQLPTWPRNCRRDPYFGPYKITKIDGPVSFIGASKYQVGSGSMCVMLALLLCHVI